MLSSGGHDQGEAFVETGSTNLRTVLECELKVGRPDKKRVDAVDPGDRFGVFDARKSSIWVNRSGFLSPEKGSSP